MIVTQPKGMSSGSQSTATKIIPTKIVYGQQGKTQVRHVLRRLIKGFLLFCPFLFPLFSTFLKTVPFNLFVTIFFPQFTALSYCISHWQGITHFPLHVASIRFWWTTGQWGYHETIHEHQVDIHMFYWLVPRNHKIYGCKGLMYMYKSLWKSWFHRRKNTIRQKVFFVKMRTASFCLLKSETCSPLWVIHAVSDHMTPALDVF